MGGHTVLVVDDDAAIRLLCRVNLELEGYRVLDADSIEVARTLVAGEPVDVVLLDVHVMAGDGLAFREELRETHPALPVAILTGSSDAARVHACGPDAVIGKPFALEELYGTVRRLAEGDRAAR